MKLVKQIKEASSYGNFIIVLKFPFNKIHPPKEFGNFLPSGIGNEFNQQLIEGYTCQSGNNISFHFFAGNCAHEDTFKLSIK